MSIRLSGAFSVALAYVFAVSVALGASALGAHAARAAGAGPEICQPDAGGSGGHALCSALCQIAGAPLLAPPGAPALGAPGGAPFAPASGEHASALDDRVVQASARGPPRA